MSYPTNTQTPLADNVGNVYAHQLPPAHHQHRSSDVLPGARGAQQPALDYSPEVTNDSRVWKDTNERRFGAGTDTSAVMAGVQHSTTDTSVPSTMDHEEQSDRPMNVQPTGAGMFFGDS